MVAAISTLILLLRGSHNQAVVIARPSCAPAPNCVPTPGTPAPSVPSGPVTAGPCATAPASPAAMQQPLFDVTHYGAAGDGATDSTPGVLAALQALQAAGHGTLYFPAGHYAISGRGKPGAAIQIASPPGIEVAGAGAGSTVLTETATKDLLSIKADGVMIHGLTLDTATNNARAAIVVVANHTMLRDARIQGGSRAFALYFAGPKGAKPDSPSYNDCNQVIDVQVSDQLSDDGFSWSFQSDGLIRNITHTGSRLAVYVVKNTLVENYTYTPGTQKGAKDGFYITPPSDNLTIRNFVSAGSGGIIGPNQFRQSSSITIDGERMTGSGQHLLVGDVKGLNLLNCNFGSSNWITFRPAVSASSVTVSNCMLAAVRFNSAATATVTGVVFQNDTFLPVAAPVVGSQTFLVASGAGQVDFTVQGGSWQNQAGGFIGGAPAHFQVNGLAGYTG